MDKVDILCLNCENMISSDKIVLHSEVCIGPSAQILKLTQSSELQGVNFRLDKLKCAIDSILYDHTKQLTTDEKMILVYLSRHISESIQLSGLSPENWIACEELSKKILEYPQDFISPCITVYLERVSLLINQKAKALKDQYTFVQSSDLFNQNAKKLQMDVENKLGDLSPENSQIRNKINQVVSIVDGIKSRYSIGSYGNAGTELSEKPDMEEIEQAMLENEMKMNRKSNEDLQKFFYTKCLVAKLKFSSRDPVQFIQIPDLYRKVKDSGISVDKWDDFINEHFEKCKNRTQNTTLEHNKGSSHKLLEPLIT